MPDRLGDQQGDLDDRLVACFAAVFPGLDAGQIRTLAASTDSGWDSLASLTLITVIEEEFVVTLSDEAVARMTSYQHTMTELAAILG